MKPLCLTPAQRSHLEVLRRSARDARMARRAQALLWHAQGHPVAQIAQLSGVSDQTIYNWIARCRQGDSELADRPRCGRPRRLQKHCAWLEHLLQQDPQALGYRQTTWTVPLLQHHLWKQQRLVVGATTLRRTLHALGYRWKRPRYVLAQRDPLRHKKKGRSAGWCATPPLGR